MKNTSNEISWLDRDIKRFKEMGTLIPESQRRIYEAIGKDWVSGRTVVDLGCSIGIGSNILSHTARFVWGLDVNKEAIIFADLMFKRPNLNFAVMDIENPTLRELSRFEVIVAVEIIEHLKDYEAGIAMVKRFFSIKGKSVAFITAPNTNNPEIKKRDKANPLHLHHWTAGKFYELMTRHFEVVTLFSGDRIKDWDKKETVDGNTKDGLIIAKLESPK